MSRASAATTRMTRVTPHNPGLTSSSRAFFARKAVFIRRTAALIQWMAALIRRKTALLARRTVGYEPHGRCPRAEDRGDVAHGHSDDADDPSDAVQSPG
jgi:hypothetical protein